MKKEAESSIGNVGGTISPEGGYNNPDRGVQFSSKDLVDLSPDQTEILAMLRDDLETPQRVAYRRKTTIWAVYKTIRKLRQKGYLKGRFDRGVQFPDTTPQRGYISSGTTPNMKQIRLHNQHFLCRILDKTGIYDRIRKATRWIEVDGNRVELNRLNIEVYCSKERSFSGGTAERALDLSMQYWPGIFTQIEEKLGVYIQKPGNIRQVSAHYAEVGNELAREVRDRQERLVIPAPEDGKGWLLVDTSTGVPELETIHPQTAYADMDSAIKPFFEDLRGYVRATGEPIRLSQVVRMFGMYAENIQSHIGAIRELGTQVGRLNELYIKLSEAKER